MKWEHFTMLIRIFGIKPSVSCESFAGIEITQWDAVRFIISPQLSQKKLRNQQLCKFLLICPTVKLLI